MRALQFILPVLLVLALAALYVIKLETWQLKRQAKALQQQIEREERAITILRADWAYLTRPQRIEKLAREHLGMRPLDPKQIIIVEE